MVVFIQLRLGSSILGQTRSLNIHEYVSMDLMKKFGIPVPKCAVAFSVEEAKQVSN